MVVKAPAENLAGQVLITGASAGIGAAFARRFAAEGRPLIVLARNAERLEAYSAALRRHYNVTVEVLPADLSTEEGCRAAISRISDLATPVDTVVNNAGFSLHRQFLQTSLDEQERLLAVNVTAVLRLSYAAATAMTGRGRGEIINIASVAGFLPRGPGATYAASKAWVTSFSESLALSLNGSGVRVTAICPGFTRTEFHKLATSDPAAGLPRWMWLDPDKVVARGLADMRAGKLISIPTRRYQALMLASRVIPRGALRSITSRR